MLAVRPNPASGQNPVYAALIGTDFDDETAPKALMGIFVLDPITLTWSLLGAPGVRPAPPTNADYTGGLGTLSFAGTTITRSDGDWREDGFAIGQRIAISNARRAANNGTYDIVGVSV